MAWRGRVRPSVVEEKKYPYAYISDFNTVFWNISSMRGAQGRASLNVALLRKYHGHYIPRYSLQKTDFGNSPSL